ncbi:hypothetical protein MPTK1_7g15640 [Marchantia polymorpha subsp. ruderalis]|uniref:MHD domain-containing protein n=2 Tax=Marchantia polymorpha TaxID=3197 RepID=A0AAF6C016_MARPO|nr:hypothetical protein MARPO_0111s0055 [Marchantia polymorpha]BBN17600.1 hypothetical protein Mp_7g15640 [Marchantia polymorpha subsp. ruderalis]|eukprot:PTQ31502.1 hypothetical protein MARPO_0111s0055 [Marchantia polymorpha]
MACLALSLQPKNGPDVLLQTREWFPPARAALASYSFRTTRENPSAGKGDVLDQQPHGLGNDWLSTASGQVVVGKESKYRVVYRLVNTIYVLGITTADQDVSSNVFECASTVNQAVSVLVAACKGIDVTADKLLRKYTEVYMALDVVLRGVSAARLATILASFHGEGIAQIVVSATDAENRVRGAESWNQVKGQSVDRLANIELLSNSTFELPEETLAAGDEAAAALGTPAQTTAIVGANVVEKPEEKPEVSEDPFAASDAINKPEELLTGGFKKNKEAPKDVTAGLSELTVPTGGQQGPTAVKGVEGFEGEYGDLEYDEPDGGFGDFEGLTDAFGGGLDPTEFGATTKPGEKKDLGLGGLEELEGGGGKKDDKDAEAKAKSATGDATPGGAVFGVDGPEASKGPVLWLTEEISADYEGAALTRVGLQGVLHLLTIPPSVNKEDTEFSFSLEGAASIKRAVVRGAIAGSLGNGIYHVRTPPSESSIPILKYRLQPRFTPIPLRLRLVSRQNPLTLSFMIQYVANPYLPGILSDVVFIVKLPFAPSTLKMAPRGALDRTSRELRWQVPQILPQASPQRLRAQLPLAPEFVSSLSSQENGQKPKEVPIKLRVEFSCRGQSLSGIAVVPVAKDSPPQFSIGEHFFKAGEFLCSLS